MRTMLLVVTGGTIAYTRPDGIKVIPLACQKIKSKYEYHLIYCIYTPIFSHLIAPNIFPCVFTINTF